MFTYRLIIGFGVALLLCSFGFSGVQGKTESRQTSEIPWDVLDSGGGLMCSLNYSVGGSLGQIAPGVCSTTTRIVSAGYWAGIDSLPRSAPCLCGDANDDGRITGADATYLLVYIYRGGPEPCNPPASYPPTIDEKGMVR